MTARARRLPLLLSGLALALFFAGLGRWQRNRGLDKVRLLAESADVLADRRPLPLSQQSRLPVRSLAWAQGRGRFAESPPVLLDNQRRGAAVGVRAYRVFLPDGGMPLLVDLGWRLLPPDRRLPATPWPDGTLWIAGLLAPPPGAGFGIGPDHVRQDGSLLALRLDMPALSGELGVALAPRVLRLDPALPFGYARDLDLLANTLPPERHRAYAVQWFGLCAATIAIVLTMGVRRR